MKSTSKRDYKIYRVTKGLWQTGEQYKIVGYLFVVVHFLCVVFLILLRIREQLIQSIPFLGEEIQYLQDNYMQIYQAQIISFASIGLSLAFIALLWIRVKLTPMYDKFSSHKRIERYLFIVNLILGYVYEMAVYPIGWAISFIYQTKGLQIFIVIGFLPVLVYTYFSIKHNTISLYKWSTIKVIFLLTSLSNLFSYLTIIGLSLYFIFTENMLLKKISYGFIILLSIFVIKHTLFAHITQNQMLISLVPFAILMLLSPILIFKLKSKSLFTNHQKQIQLSYNLLCQVQSDPFKQLRFKQFHVLYSTVMNLIQIDNDAKNKKNQHLLKKLPQKMTKNDFFLLLEKYLDKEVKKSSKNKFIKQIFLFKIKMQLSRPISEMSEKLFLLNEEYLRSNKSYQYEFFSLFDEFINRYSVFNDGILQTAFILYSNEMHQDFQDKVICLLDKVSNFWSNMTNQKMKRIDLDDSFDEIVKLKEEIYNMCTQMQKYGSFKRERKVINILKSLFNSYEEESKISVEHIKTVFQADQQQINHSFLILQDNVIKFVSKDLVKNLGDKSKMAYEKANKKALFGDEFSEMIDSMIKNSNLETQKVWGTIPILRKNGLIDLKKINIMWYPSFETKCRLMIRFEQEGELRKPGFIIYENRTDTIKFVNEKFIVDFNINKEKFLQRLENQHMFFNELFVHSEFGFEGNKKQLKEDTQIKCKLCIKGFAPSGAPNMIPVDVKVVKTIPVENSLGYLVIRVEKEDQKKVVKAALPKNIGRQKNHLSEERLPGAMELSNKNYRSLALKYEKEKFFCPIPNHYQSKIIEKQAQLDKKNRGIGRNYLHLIMGAMFSTIIIIWSLQYKFYSDRVTTYEEEKIAIQNTSEQYALLYDLFSYVSRRYYIAKYPQQVQYATGKTSQMVDDSIKNSQQSHIDDFLLRYLTQFSFQPNSKVSYNLRFQYFNISTDSNQSTLVDFIENFKTNLANNSVDFLLKNYDSFRNLTIKFSDSFIIDQQIDNITARYDMYLYILITTTVIGTGLIFYTMYKIEGAINVVYRLFEMISIKGFEINSKKFNTKKEKIINSLYKPVITVKKTMQNSNNNIQTTQISRTVTETNNGHSRSQSTLKLPLNYKFPQKDKTHHSSHDIEINQNQINESNSFLTEGEQPNMMEINKTKNKSRIVDESILVKIARKAYFIALLIGFNVVFYFDYSDVQRQNDGYTQIFGIQKNLYDSLLHVTRIQADAIIQPVMRDYFNGLIGASYQTSTVSLITEVSEDLIFTQLQSMIQKARNYLKQDICSNLESQITFNIKPCRDYLNGIVTKGFGETFDYYQLNAKIVSNQQLSEFGAYPCTTDKCPAYYEHTYVAGLMAASIRAVLDILNSAIDDLDDSRLSLLTTRTIYKILSLFLVILIYIVLDNNLKRRCWRSIQYFRMVPKQLMCTMKMSRYMSRNEILNEFDLL